MRIYHREWAADNGRRGARTRAWGLIGMRPINFRVQFLDVSDNVIIAERIAYARNAAGAARSVIHAKT